MSNYKFYFIAALGFLSIPVVLVILMLSPYMFPQTSYIYFFLKPYGQQVFVNKQIMWNYVGILSAGVGVFIGFYYKDWSDKVKFNTTIKAFYDEILRNTDLIFSGEVERPYIFDAFEKINQEYVDKINDNDKFREIRIIYDELYYYREIVKIWRLHNAEIVTERQFGVCNKILDYFEKSLDPNIKIPAKILGGNKWEKLRTLAIDKKNKNNKKWKQNLKKDLEEIFYVNISKIH